MSECIKGIALQCFSKSKITTTNEHTRKKMANVLHLRRVSEIFALTCSLHSAFDRLGICRTLPRESQPLIELGRVKVCSELGRLNLISRKAYFSFHEKTTKWIQQNTKKSFFLSRLFSSNTIRKINICHRVGVGVELKIARKSLLSPKRCSQEKERRKLKFSKYSHDSPFNATYRTIKSSGCALISRFSRLLSAPKGFSPAPENQPSGTTKLTQIHSITNKRRKKTKMSIYGAAPMKQTLATFKPKPNESAELKWRAEIKGKNFAACELRIFMRFFSFFLELK